MLHSAFRRLSLGSVLVLVLGVACLSWPSAERTGDRLQIALPLVGLACAAANGRALIYVGRYIVLETAIKTPKFALGDLAVNRRPNGNSQGFPSGHTAAATFGAVGLSQTCLSENRPAQAVALMAAGFTGGSRIGAGAHTLPQVLAGVVVGWLSQVLALRWIARQARRAGATLRRMLPILALTLVGASLAPAAQAEIELSLYTGLQNAHSNDVSGNDPTGVGNFNFSASWDGDSFSAPPYYGVRATWWRSADWGFHLDFTHSKAYASDATLAATGFQSLEFSDGLNNVTLGVTRRWLNQWGRATPYVGAGAGFIFPHVEVQTSPTAQETFEYQVAGPNVALIAGVSYELNDRWRLFGEYKGTYSWLDADLQGGGNISTEIWTNAINFGVSFVFN